MNLQRGERGSLRRGCLQQRNRDVQQGAGGRVTGHPFNSRPTSLRVYASSTPRVGAHSGAGRQAAFVACISCGIASAALMSPDVTTPPSPLAVSYVHLIVSLAPLFWECCCVFLPPLQTKVTPQGGEAQRARRQERDAASCLSSSQQRPLIRFNRKGGKLQRMEMITEL